MMNPELIFIKERWSIEEIHLKTLRYIKPYAPKAGPGVPSVCKNKEAIKMSCLSCTPGPGLGTSTLEVLCTV